MGKFKSGDILVCIPGFHGDEISIQSGIDNRIDNGGSGYEVGLISKADDVSGDICFGFKNGDGVFDRALRLATPAEEIAYKAGIVHIDDVHVITGTPVGIHGSDLIKGDVVAFLETNRRKKIKPGYSVPKFYCESDGIPEDLIKHGSTVCTSGTGTVVDFYKQYIIVEYQDAKRVMRLGFLRESLELISMAAYPETKSFTISYIDLEDKLQKVTIEEESKEKALSTIKAKSINYVMGG